MSTMTERPSAEMDVIADGDDQELVDTFVAESAQRAVQRLGRPLSIWCKIGRHREVEVTLSTRYERNVQKVCVRCGKTTPIARIRTLPATPRGAA